MEVETPANQLLNLRLPNLIVTPHVAWASNQAIEEFRQQLVDNLEAFAAGDPRNAITALKEGALDSWQCTLKSGDSSPDNTGA